ncbi:MAG: hypothetical protein ACI9UK_000485 [Candidatus Krumholzibacteriia bacterium]
MSYQPISKPMVSVLAHVYVNNEFSSLWFMHIDIRALYHFAAAEAAAVKRRQASANVG